MANMEINRTWIKYEEMVLKGKRQALKDEAFRGFIGGWASAYAYMMGLIMNPTLEGQQKIIDLRNELKGIQGEIERRVKE